MDAGGAVAVAGAVTVNGSAWGVLFPVSSWVGTGVGNCTAGIDSAAGVSRASRLGCEVGGSAVDARVSGAAADDDGAAGAAPGLRRAALGANFLPVVFSIHVLAARVLSHGTTHY